MTVEIKTVPVKAFLQLYEEDGVKKARLVAEIMAETVQSDRNIRNLLSGCALENFDLITHDSHEPKIVVEFIEIGEGQVVSSLLGNGGLGDDDDEDEGLYDADDEGTQTDIDPSTGLVPDAPIN